MSQDQVITETMAQAIQADAARKHVQFAWTITRDQPEYPDKIVARFANAHPSVYVLLADSLTAMRRLLPPGLELSERQPADLPEVVEIWFSKP